MSEEKQEYLQRDLFEARNEAKKYRLARKKATEELNLLKSEHEKLVKELEGYRAKPDEQKAEVERLRGLLRGRDHRDAFKGVAKTLNVRDEAVGDLWKVLDYKAETDVPDEAMIRGLVEGAVKERPWLLAESQQEVKEVKLTKSPGVERGGSQGLNGYTIHRTDYQNVEFMRKNQAKISQAQKEGNLNVLDD